jgi:hypothetical protein
VAFVGGGLVVALVLAAGRFGADVGAAIVLSIGAVVAAVPSRGFRALRPEKGVQSLEILVPAVSARALALSACLAFAWAERGSDK